MSEVRVLLRFFILLVFTVVVVCGCAQRNAVTPLRAGGGGPCGGGKGVSDRQAPIVCVDDLGATLSVDPDPIVLHDKLRGGGNPVTLQWFTRSGGNDLQLEIEPGCVSEVKCDGKGHCTAKSRDIDSETKCKYVVWTDKHPRLDPDIVVTPCC